MQRMHLANYVVTPVLAIALFVFGGQYCKGQALAGAEIHGRVTDPSGAGIPGATVRATQVDTKYTRSTKTDPEGNYHLADLPVGPYILEIHSEGFQSQVQSGIVLQVGNNIQSDVALQVGSVTENVNVTASVSMVETRDTSVSQVIERRQIMDLPLNGRQPTQLILISGASTPSPNGNLISSKNYPSSTTMSVAGGQGNGTNYLLDGGDNNDTFSNVNLPFPFPDALQEFSVQTNSLPARNGLHPGGVVNVITKSGTNETHGDLFEFVRNGDFNARNFFAPVHDSLKRNQFGGTAGGKIIRDKLFFFAGFQGTRERQTPPSSVAFVPTPAALRGDFSALESAACQSNGKTRTIVNPATGQAFANAQVPTALFDPVALKVVEHLPIPSDQCGKVTFGIPNNDDEDQVIARIDWTRSERHSVFGRYFIADYRNPAVYDPKNAMVTQRAGLQERSQSATIGDTFSFNPTTVNSFHATFTRLRNNRGPAPDGYNARDLGANMFVFDPPGMQLTVSNAFSTGCGTCAPGIFNRNTFQVAEDIDLVLGKHQVAFGVDIIRGQNNLSGHYNENGIFGFNGQFSNDPLLDFLLGDMNRFGQSRAQVNVYRQTILGLYVEDTYKVNKRFVLNAGLRWEPMLFPQDYFARGMSFSMAGFLANQHSTQFTNAPAGLLFYGDKDIPRAFTHDKFGVLSPRLGVVWNPHGDGRDTFRVGGGILYDTAEIYYAERLTTNAPYAGQIDLTSSGPLSNPWAGYPGGNPFPGQDPPPAKVAFPIGGTYAAIPLDLHPTYMTQWNASYQRQLGGNWMASVTYLGNKTSHLWLSVDVNPAVYIPGTCGTAACSTTGNTNARRVLSLANPNEGKYYASLITTDDGANARYNGLLASIQHRFSHGFTFLANYTWSHCISDGDFAGNVGNEQFQNQQNRRADRGDCNFDIRHIFNASFVGISPPWGMSWTKRLVRDWQVAPLVRASSGLPVNILTGKDNSLTSVNLDRPDLVSGVNPYTSSLGSQLQWFNASAFAPNALGTFGNLGRDVLRASGRLNIDLALSRLFAIAERYKLEARGEAFNIINHTNFNAPVVSLNSANFGRITSANDPRILQFALKLIF